jgi:hypothetical protein
MKLQQREQGDSLSEPVLAREQRVEREARPAGEQLAQHAEPPLERDGRPDVARVRGGRNPEQAADRLAELLRVVGDARRLQRHASQRRGQRRRPVQVPSLIREQTGEMRSGVAVAPVFEHPRQQLLGRLLRSELDLLLVAWKQESRLELEQRSDQDKELGRGLEVQLPGSLEVLDVRDHDVAQVDVHEVDLLPEDEGQQEVERPRERVQVELELGGAHRRNSRGQRGVPTPIARRTSARVSDAIARALSAPAASVASSVASSPRSSP